MSGPVSFETNRSNTGDWDQARTTLINGVSIQYWDSGAVSFNSDYRNAAGELVMQRIYIADTNYATAAITTVSGAGQNEIEVEITPEIAQRFLALTRDDRQDRVWSPEEISAATTLANQIFATVTPETLSAQELAAARAAEEERNAPINFETQTDNYDGVSRTSRTASTRGLLDNASLTIDSEGVVSYSESKFGDDDVSRDTSLIILPDNSSLLTISETSDRGTTSKSFELTAEQARTIREELAGQASDNIWRAEEVSRADSLTAPFFERAAQMARDGGGRE